MHGEKLKLMTKLIVAFPNLRKRLKSLKTLLLCTYIYMYIFLPVCVIEAREVAENCIILGYDAASSNNFLPTFRYNLSVSSSGLKNTKESLQPQYGVFTWKSVGWYHTTEIFHLPHKHRFGAKVFLLDFWTPRMGPIGCPESSVRNFTLRTRCRSDFTARQTDKSHFTLTLWNT